MRDAKILFQEKKFGTTFFKKLKAAVKSKYKPLPEDEIQTIRVWLYKMYDRIVQGDTEGQYRRSWLHEALLSDYFNIRKKRYVGSKQSFEWLKKNVSETYCLFEKVLANPTELRSLKLLISKWRFCTKLNVGKALTRFRKDIFV